MLTRCVLLIMALLTTVPGYALDYPVLFMAMPKVGTGIPKINSLTSAGGGIGGPYKFFAGTDMMILNPDGTERTLVPGIDGELVAIHDRCVHFDGTKVYYTHIGQTGTGGNTKHWSDIWVIDIDGKNKMRLTDARNEYSPPSGVGNWALNVPGKSEVWNSGPCLAKLSTGNLCLVFTSSRNGIQSPHESYTAQQLYRMDLDGRNVEKIGHLNLGGAAHPVVAKNGKIYFSSGEQQGHHSGNGDSWAIWNINPDGTDWGPVISATPMSMFGTNGVLHFLTQTSNGTWTVADYYDTRVYGSFMAVPPFFASPFSPPTPFGDPLKAKNQKVWNGRKSNNKGQIEQLSWSPRDMYALLPWSTNFDQENKDIDGSFLGMVSHPAAIPGNGILLTWTGDKGDAAANLGIYSVSDVAATKPTGFTAAPQSQPIQPWVKPSDLIKIVDKEDRHEWLATPVIPYVMIHGTEPAVPAAMPIATDLPEGSPYGVIGTTSLSVYEIINTDGTMRLLHDPEDAEWVQIQAFNPTLSMKGTKPEFTMESNGGRLPYNPSFANFEGFSSAINERAGLYTTRIPIKKWTNGTAFHFGSDPPSGFTRVLGPDGKPDASFRAQIPADHPWTIQILNAKREVIWGTSAMTWHQVRPRESRTNCQGCHAHNAPTPYSFSETFAGSNINYPAYKLDKIETVVYERDIKPILDRSGVTMDRRVWVTSPQSPQPPVVQAYGSGISDLDDNPAFLPAEQVTVRKWIDTGMMAAGTWAKSPLPYSSKQVAWDDYAGPYADTVPPTLELVVNADQLLVGACDPQAGLKEDSLSVKCSIPLGGKDANTELADLFTQDGDVWSFPLETPLKACVITVSIRDNQKAINATEDGNITKIIRTIR